MAKRKLKSLSVKQKLTLLEEVDKGRKRKKEIAAQFGIPSSTLSTILKNRATFQQNLDSVPRLNPARRRFTKCVFEDVDKCVLQWIMPMFNENVRLTNDMIRQRAKHFALSLGHSKFQASTGWLEKFKARHGILQKNDKYNSRICVSSDFPPFPGKSSETGQSMSADHTGKVLVKLECQGNVAAADVDYLNKDCDVFPQDSGAIKSEMESSWENNERDEIEPFLVFRSAEAQMALQTIRKYLNSRENVPGNIYDALNVIEEYCDEKRVDVDD